MAFKYGTLMKFQLYLRKLQFKLLKYWYRLQSALAGLNGKQVKQITIQLVVRMLLSTKQAFQNAGWSNQRFRYYFQKLPLEVTLGS